MTGGLRTKTENGSPPPPPLAFHFTSACLCFWYAFQNVNHKRTKFCLKTCGFPRLQPGAAIKAEKESPANWWLVCATKASRLTRLGLPQTHLRQDRMFILLLLSESRPIRYFQKVYIFPSYKGFFRARSTFWFGSRTFFCSC